MLKLYVFTWDYGFFDSSVQTAMAIAHSRDEAVDRIVMQRCRPGPYLLERVGAEAAHGHMREEREGLRKDLASSDLEVVELTDGTWTWTWTD